MSTSNSTYNHPFREHPLLERFSAARARLRRRRLYVLGSTFLAVFLACFILILPFEAAYYLSGGVKTAFLFLSLAVAAFALRFVQAKQEPPPSFSTFYARFADFAGKPDLKYAFDLLYDHRNTGSKLYEKAVDTNLEKLDSEEIARELDRFLAVHPVSRWQRHTGTAAAVFALSTALFALIAADPVVRTVSFWKNFKAPNPFEYTIAPGNTTIEQGSRFQPEVRFEGRSPNRVEVAIQTDAETEPRVRRMSRPDTSDAFSSSPITMNNDARYRIIMDEFESALFRLDVQLRPRLDSLAATVIPPSYTGLEASSEIYPFYRLEAYPGSEIQLSGRTNKPVSGLSITDRRSNTVTLALQNSRTFSHRIEVEEADTFRFIMVDSSGLSNENSFEFAVDPVEDEPPFVEITDPAGDREMRNPEPIDLQYEADDDFGLTGAALHYEIDRAFRDEPETGRLSVDLPEDETGEFRWELDRLDLNPRDAITFWMAVTDNDEYRGGKSSESSRRTITFPSMATYVDELSEREADVGSSLEEVSDGYRQMREEYDRFRESLQQQSDDEWEQQQSLDEMENRREEIDRQVDRLNEQFEELSRDMEQSGMMSDETRRAYNELKQLFEEIDDPELVEALQELQRSMEQMSPNQLREAMENFEFNEEMYRERLNRTINLFKRLKLNSKLDRTARTLEDLAGKEGNLAEREEDRRQEIEEQESIREDTEQLRDQIEELGDDPPDRNREEVEQLQEDTGRRLDQIEDMLNENIEQLQQKDGDSDEIRSQQEQLQQQYQDLAQSMQDAQQQMSGQRIQVNMAALQYILNSLIHLSIEQEEIVHETENLAGRSQGFVEQARSEQRILEHFGQLADSLYNVSKEIPQFSNRINEKKRTVLNNLEQAVSRMSDRNKSQATYIARQSLGGINELGSMVASLLDQLQNQQGGGGGGMSMQQFMEQMQQMSGEQQQLNDRIQQMINDIQGDRLTQDQMERVNQLARQQNEIRKQLKELQESGALESGDRILSELERMSEEMENTINEIRGGQMDEQLADRQQNILSRMLSAERAIDERGEEDEREGDAPEETPRTVPPNVTLEELQQNIRNMLNEPDQTRFSRDYRELIEQYFELLRKLEEEQEVES